MMSQPNAPIPITLLSGFLGAGKTTLMNHMLHAGYGGERVAVLVNDFGKLAIDASLIRHEEQGLIELNSGCICCTLQINLISSIQTVVERGGFERIILEASGISNTPQLLSLFGQTDVPAEVDELIAVVDARRFLKLCDRMIILKAQVADANIVLLNRCDEATPELVKQTHDWLNRLAPEAKVIETTHCRVDVDHLRTLREQRHRSRVGQPRFIEAGNDTWHTAEVLLAQPVDRHAIMEAVRRLPVSVIRVKGFIREDGVCWALHRVGETCTLEPADAGIRGPGADRVGELVLIGDRPFERDATNAFADIPGMTLSAGGTQRGHPDRF